MKLLVLTDHYLPEIKAPSFRVSEHARCWIDDGHEVTVVTSAPNYPRGQVFPGYRNRLYQEEALDGVRVVRLGTFITNSQSAIRRFLDHFSFVVSATFLCWRLPKCDAILATSPPLFTALAGWMLSVLLRKPWVFEVRDLWPATINAVTTMPRWLIRTLELLELFLYRRADGIVVVTDGFREILVQRGVDSNKITVATNGVDTERFRPTDCREAIRAQLGVSEETLLIGYMGTLGLCQDLRNAVRAMAVIGDRTDIRLLILGEGAEEDAIKELAAELRLTNVLFHQPVNRETLLGFYSAIDVSLVHLKRDPTFETVIPSKIFEAMAASTPVLLACEGESARIVNRTRCGICVPPGDPNALAAAIGELAESRAEFPAMGESGLRAAQSEYSRAANAARVMEHLRSVCGARSNLDRSDSVPTRKAA